MAISVSGATGALGRLVINQLKDKIPAADLVALVRSPAKASDLGVSAREADYSKPEILDQALAGVNTLLLISSSEVGRRGVQQHNVIAAAKNQGVKRIVYTSLLHADTSALSLADEHRETEAELKASGLLFTILRTAGTPRITPLRFLAPSPAARSWAARTVAGSRRPRGWTTPRQP